jgi:hypothetical protein
MMWLLLLGRVGTMYDEAIRQANIRHAWTHTYSFSYMRLMLAPTAASFSSMRS